MIIKIILFHQSLCSFHQWSTHLFFILFMTFRCCILSLKFLTITYLIGQLILIINVKSWTEVICLCWNIYSKVRILIRVLSLALWSETSIKGFIAMSIQTTLGINDEFRDASLVIWLFWSLKTYSVGQFRNLRNSQFSMWEPISYNLAMLINSQCLITILISIVVFV